MKNNKPNGNHVWLWAIKNSKKSFTTVLILALFVTIFELSIPWLLEKVIDEALKDEVNVSQLNEFGLIMLGIIVCIYLAHHSYLRTQVKMLCEISYGLHRRMYQHLMAQPLSYFKRKKSGEVIHRISSDSNEFEHHCAALLSELPYESMVAIGVIGMMIYLDAMLAGFIVGFLVITSIVSAKIGRPLPTLERRVQILGARFTNRLQEIMQGIKTIKSFGTESSESDFLDKANQRRVEVKRTSGQVESYLLPIFDLMETLGVVFVVWYGAHLILEDQLTAGGLVAFIAYMEYLAGPVSRAGKYYKHWREASGIAFRIDEFLNDSDHHPEMFPNSSQSLIPQNINSVVFDRVSFRYPKTESYALKEISFTIKRGEIVALVGRNGAGKSTAMELLQRFYAPETGRILAGNADLRAWDQTAWRRSVGIMTQDVFLFNANIRDNISYGHSAASSALIDMAINKAGVESVIAKLPKGLDSMVGEKGSKLSGGERQRIALARLFLNNPQVIIYDEPTAAMDGEAAKEIARTILKLAENRLSIIIAHQAEMVAIADRVILFDEGQVVDSGSHDHLINHNELYRKLFESIEHKKNYQELYSEIHQKHDNIDIVGT